MVSGQKLLLGRLRGVLIEGVHDKDMEFLVICFVRGVQKFQRGHMACKVKKSLGSRSSASRLSGGEVFHHQARGTPYCYCGVADMTFVKFMGAFLRSTVSRYESRIQHWHKVHNIQCWVDIEVKAKVGHLKFSKSIGIGIGEIRD